MLKLSEPEGKLRSLLKKIERGRGNEIIAETFLKLLSKNEEYMAKFTPAIIACLKKQDVNTLKYSTYLLRKIAQFDLKQVENSIPLLIEILKKPARAGEQEIRENSAILIYYAAKLNPEVLRDSAGVIVENLDDLYSTVRRISYTTLLSIATLKPEYLLPSIPQLIKSLGSIHQDTRAAAAHIIGIIGEKYPKKVLNSYPYLKFLAWYHTNSEIRLEASIALEKIERQLVTKEGICPIFRSNPEEKTCNICKQQCELSIANPDHIIAKRLIKNLEQVKKNREAMLAKRIEAMPEEEKEEALVKKEEELDELFKDIRKSFSAEKVLETLGLAHMIQPRESKCMNCGAILPSNAKYCIECGAKVVVEE
ncbi:MAG: zinc ribbon domain-containing protein [Methanocellales archaeon]